jgi:hypothetical protein
MNVNHGLILQVVCSTPTVLSPDIVMQAVKETYIGTQVGLSTNLGYRPQ